MKLFIKNMVCPRCIKVVKEELEKLNIEVTNIFLGEVEIKNNLSERQKENIKSVLFENGFELIENKFVKLIEEIKNSIIQLIQTNTEKLHYNLSDFLEQKLSKDYSYLSSLFSSKENITIEQFYILQKIEKVKELLKYDELSLSEISYKLGYNSVNHLSSQFKKSTRMTAKEFKKNTSAKRKPIDKIS